MLESASDAKPSNYSRGDESARRLWLTQRTKANPWDQRTPNPEEESAGNTAKGDGQALQARTPDPAAPTLISQTDRLSLHPLGPQPIENPFASLIVNRLGLDTNT